MMIIDEVEIVFNYGGSWVISPLLVYTKKLVHSWLNFDPELLSHKDMCDEFTSKLGLSRVKQLLVTGPSGKYYIIDGDDGIRAILSLLCEKFKVVNFFVVEEDVEVSTDCEHNAGSDYEWYLSESEECDYEWIKAISKEMGRVVGDRLENFKELQVGMTFKDMKEDGAKITFISDMQKGLIDVVDKVLPEAQHSSYNEEFKDQLNKLGKLSKDGARDLVKNPQKAWCRAYFDTQCKNMIVDNNFTEPFNAWILEARAKPIIKIPKCMKLYIDYKAITHGCKLEFNGDWDYEVSDGEDWHTVFPALMPSKH
ncbi:hypothetical protein KY285_031145 [Solanum tuberosum]|nr:hypothetical protein KY285_031145 [Solanum tuberosum]